MKISKRLPLTVILILFLILFVFSYIKIKNNKSLLMKEFEHRVKYISTFLQDVNKISIWNFDRKSTINTTKTLMKEKILQNVIYFKKDSDDEIFVALLKDKDKIKLIDKGYFKDIKSKQNDKFIKVINKDIFYNDQYISSVQLHYTTEFINRKIRKSVFSMFFEFLILAVLLFFVLYYSINKILLMPFGNITYLASDFSKQAEALKNELKNINSNFLKKYKIDTSIIENSKNFNKQNEIGMFYRKFYAILATLNTELDIIINYSISLEEKVEERTRELKRTQQEMIDQAHKAGMAELAASTLHNIGNAANSLSIKIESIPKEILKKNKLILKSYQKINKLIMENISDLNTFFENDKTGKKIPQIFTKTNRLFINNLEDEKKEIQDLKKLINHVIDIIHVQNSYTSGVKTIEENLRLAKVVDDSVEILYDSCKKRDIEIIKNYKSDVNIFIEKNKLLQVIVNLLKNSIEAIDEREKQEEFMPVKKIKLTCKKIFNWGILKIKDNGIGFEKNIEDKLFEYKFSTKERGSGFGLHYCGNYMNSVEGKVKAFSKGNLKGATIILIFPLAKS